MSDYTEKKSKGEITQERIIHAALKLYGQNGFSQTSMQMIANECELSQGAVMQHFKSKQRLFEAVRKYVTISNHQFVDSLIQPIDDGFVSLKKHILGNLGWALKNRAQVSIVYITYEAGICDEEKMSVSLATARLGTERILRYLYSAQREKLIQVSGPIEQIAEIIHEYLLGMVLRTLNFTMSQKIPVKVEERVEFFLSQLLKYSKKM